ncbi:MAG TPA: hypothetical protein PLU24_06095, partial [Candidatus Omnitrophota bacterium]|nr:hypothetical protein [Candidatus Omnitrophota bacterium]
MTSCYKFRKIIMTIFIPLLFAGSVSSQDLSQEGIVSSASSGKISLDIKGMDIVDVLKMLATKADINLVIDKNVMGRVTVFLREVAPEDALSVILRSNSLVAEKQGSIT